MFIYLYVYINSNIRHKKEFVQEEDDQSNKVRSPFTSKAAMSVSKNSLLPTLSPSLSESLTDEVNDYFIVTIT